MFKYQYSFIVTVTFLKMRFGGELKFNISDKNLVPRIYKVLTTINQTFQNPYQKLGRGNEQTFHFISKTGEKKQAE